VRQAQRRVASVRGDARVRVEGHAFSGAVRQFVAAAQPDRVHVETLDFFGNPVAVLAAGDGRLALYDARAKVLYRGAATPANLARLVPLPLSPEELVTILCGSAPLVVARAVDARPGRGFVALELADGARTQSLRVRAAAAIERSALRVAGARAAGTYDLVFSEFEPIAGSPFPTRIALTAEEPRVSLQVAWGDVEVNAALEPELFHMETPRGARVVDLDAETGAPAGGTLYPEAPPGE
jgi:hypothetical protein